MKRSAPMKRTAFKRAETLPRRESTQSTYTPRPRPTALPIEGVTATMAVPVPKTAYVRDERLRDMCRDMPCQHCGASGDGAGVTWAHSNWAIHGKAKGIKASDVYVAALCWVCHRELDQGHRWSEPQKLAVWTAAHLRTVALAVLLGTWPKDIPIPTPFGKQS
ncbi:MAG: hypothetical protein ACOVO0_11310 [Burkholderiaceae bacterium]